MQTCVVLGASSGSQPRVKFISLQQGSLSIFEHVVGFFESVGHTPILFPTEKDLNQGLLENGWAYSHIVS